MSNVIQFLEAVGSKPLSPGEYAASVAELEVNDAQRQALFNRDHVTLNSLLDGRDIMHCMVATPDNEEAPVVPDDDSEDEEEGKEER
ncbi:MAG TPA: hypothetical protein VHF02_06670 [Luteimonas sp.]|nr:hypothetical protein [Luteimonas sp.]